MSVIRDIIEETVGVAIERALPFWVRDLLVIVLFGLAAAYWDALPPIVIDFVVGGWASLVIGVLTMSSALRGEAAAFVMPVAALFVGGLVRVWSNRSPFDLPRAFVFAIALLLIDSVIALRKRKANARADEVRAERVLARFAACFVVTVVGCVAYDANERIQMLREGGHPILAVQVCVATWAALVVTILGRSKNQMG